MTWRDTARFYDQKCQRICPHCGQVDDYSDENPGIPSIQWLKTCRSQQIRGWDPGNDGSSIERGRYGRDCGGDDDRIESGHHDTQRETEENGKELLEWQSIRLVRELNLAPRCCDSGGVLGRNQFFRDWGRGHGTRGNGERLEATCGDRLSSCGPRSKIRMPFGKKLNTITWNTTYRRCTA
jgi:hypothetical protein